MRFLRATTTILLLTSLLFALPACSGSSKGGQSPVEPSPQISDLPTSLGTEDSSGRDVLAVYDAVIDPQAGTFIITPAERMVDYHFPLSQYYPNVLKITGYGFTPNFWADIKIKHPLPGSIYDGFDPRVIAILPVRPGVYFYYPTLGVYGNNAVVLEPDGYTKLFDELAGKVNPFKAYFKNQSYRRWSSTGVTEETQRWQMKLTGFGGPMQYKLVVDVSTNYPAPPTPITDNAPEPVQIDARVSPGLMSAGGSANISVTLLDWQGQTGIGGVLVEAPDLFNGTVSLAYYSPGPNPNEYIYTGKITNPLLAPEGEYKILVATWDQATGINLYREFVAIVSDEGNLIRAKRAGGAGADIGYGITTLSDNSTVVTGYFYGIAKFGPGEPNETLLTSDGGADIFIARYNPDGTLAWAKRAGGSSDNEYGFGITKLSDDSTVVTGWFLGSATFGPDEPNQTVLTSPGGSDIFIAQYNPDGTLGWAKRAGGSWDDYGLGITTLSDNSTVVTGFFYGAATFGPGEPNQTVLTSAGNCDIFIAKYDLNGTLAWAKRAGGLYEDHSYGITTLSDNSTVVTGHFGYPDGGSAIFGPSEPNETVLTSAGNCDIFIAKYNLDGTLAWAKRAGGSNNYWTDGGRGITTLSDNSTVVTGFFSWSAIFGPGEPNETVLIAGDYYDGWESVNIFIARYNPDGTLAWAKKAGSSYDYNHGDGITILSDNSTVVTGQFWGTAKFGPGEPNQTILTSAGFWDVFVARYNPDGTLAWAKCAGGTGLETGRGITTLSDNSTVVTGYFYGSATFGPNEPNETILTSAGGNDIFIARFAP